MTKIHAIYQNGVFRPIGPVHVDDGTQVELSFEETTGTGGRASVTVGATGLPLIVPPPGTRPITNEDVARALDDD